MRVSPAAPKSRYAFLAALAPLALAACNSAEEPTYETDTVDESGGELIVTEEDPNAVPVDTPDTEMTPVAPETGEAPAE